MSAKPTPATPVPATTSRTSFRRRPWPRFLARRIGQVAAGFAALVTLSFFMIHMLPGDPARAIAGMTAPAEYVERRRVQLGLHEPLWTQFREFVGGAVRFDFGVSFAGGDEVTAIMARAASDTFVLATLAMVVAVVVALGAGLLVASRTWDGSRRRWTAAFGFAAGCVTALPNFVLAVVLVFVFAVTLGMFPIAGSTGARSLVLPVSAIAAAPAAALARVVRVEAVRVLNEDYVRTARSKRLSGLRLYVRHVLPNTLTAALTVGGLVFGAVLGGTLVIENVFARHGIGTVAVKAVLSGDYPVIQAAVILLGGTVLLINAGVDVAVALLNPRSLRQDR